MFKKIKIKLVDGEKSLGTIKVYPDDTILTIKERIFLDNNGKETYYPPFINLSLLEEPKDMLNNYRRFLKYNYKQPALSKNDITNLSDTKFKIKLEKYKTIKTSEVPKPKRTMLYNTDIAGVC